MPALIAFLGRVLMWLAIGHAAKIVVKVLAFFGISMAVYHYQVGPILDVIQAQLSGLSGAILDTVRLLNFDRAITLVLSAAGVRAAQSTVNWVTS